MSIWICRSTGGSCFLDKMHITALHTGLRFPVDSRLTYERWDSGETTWWSEDRQETPAVKFTRIWEKGFPWEEREEGGSRSSPLAPTSHAACVCVALRAWRCVRGAACVVLHECMRVYLLPPLPLSQRPLAALGLQYLSWCSSRCSMNRCEHIRPGLQIGVPPEQLNGHQSQRRLSHRLGNDWTAS